MPSKRITKPASKSSLLPRGPRRTAKVGQRDETLLRLLCDDSATGEAKELHFRNIPHKAINWSDANHIGKINNWRNQIYGRAGMKSKAVLLWVEDEELWFELYYQLSIAEARTNGILLPKVPAVLAAFNDTFAGRILQDIKGNDTEPRAERSANAFASKLNRMCTGLHNRLNQCVFGKSGDVYVPTITLNMVHAYKRMKQEMAHKGITVESAYSDNLAEWLHFFSHLPTVSGAEQEISREDIAAEALLDLYTRPVKVQDYAEAGGECAAIVLFVTTHRQLADHQLSQRHRRIPSPPRWRCRTPPASSLRSCRLSPLPRAPMPPRNQIRHPSQRPRIRRAPISPRCHSPRPSTLSIRLRFQFTARATPLPILAARLCALARRSCGLRRCTIR